MAASGTKYDTLVVQTVQYLKHLFYFIFQCDEMSKFDNYDQNPWMVEQLEDFLFFCCPECDEKCRTKDIFLQHALCHHPNVS